MKKAIATSAFVVAIIPLCVIAYLSLCYPNTAPASSSYSPSAKLVSNSLATAGKPTALNAYENKRSGSEQAMLLNVLKSNAPRIASNSGITESEALAEIDEMKIETWKTATLPDEAVESFSVSVTTTNGNATMTAFKCNGNEFLQVNSNDNCFTLSIPESESESASKIALAA